MPITSFQGISQPFLSSLLLRPNPSRVVTIYVVFYWERLRQTSQISIRKLNLIDSVNKIIECAIVSLILLASDSTSLQVRFYVQVLLIEKYFLIFKITIILIICTNIKESKIKD